VQEKYFRKVLGVDRETPDYVRKRKRKRQVAKSARAKDGSEDARWKRSAREEENYGGSRKKGKIRAKGR
jgi:hypothetical protein